MNDIVKKIKVLADRFYLETVAIRKHLHQYPELSFQEVGTAKYISEQLTQLNIEHQSGWAGNGVVAYIYGQGSRENDRCIALRADIDALPILEENKVTYRSKNKGVMHACGHDVHTASLLGTAKILKALEREFVGVVKLIFQPAEEKLPGGASLLIKAGVLENPSPSCIYGQHVHPELHAGKIGIKSGMFMASADEIFITIIGKGGHGAMPEKCVDPVLISAYLLTTMQQVISRKAPSTVPSVLTFGKIESEGGATNIIPQKVHLEGTFRTLNEEWRKDAHDEMKKVAFHLTESMGAQVEIDIKVGYPYLENNPELTLRTKQRAIDYFGEKNVIDLSLRMTAEDFAFYSQEIPACFYRLGVGKEGSPVTPVHTATFDIDHEALKYSIGFMAYNAIEELTNNHL